jgi:hypothetical protein
MLRVLLTGLVDAFISSIPVARARGRGGGPYEVKLLACVVGVSPGAH